MLAQDDRPEEMLREAVILATLMVHPRLIARFESAAAPYPVFALSGFLVWLFVFNSISFAANSLVGNTNLVTKIYFPRLIVPISATLSGLFDLVFSFAVLAVVTFWPAVSLVLPRALGF